MRWLLPLLCVGCWSSECVVDKTVIESGTGMLGGSPVTAVAWEEAGPPTITQHVSFEIAGIPGIECKGIPWSAVEHGVVVDVSENCFGYYDDHQPLANVTLSATSTLDDNGLGTVTLHVDMPNQRVSDWGWMEVDALVVNVTFSRGACSGSSWGIWDM